jgi:hypothetical protein
MAESGQMNIKRDHPEDGHLRSFNRSQPENRSKLLLSPEIPLKESRPGGAIQKIEAGELNVAL